MHAKESTSSSPSDSELDVGTAKQVYYQERGKVPGLNVRRVALVLVCHGYPLHRVQFPPEPELELLNVNHCIMFYALEFTLEY